MSSAIVHILATCAIVLGAQGMSAAITSSAQALAAKPALKDEPRTAVMRTEDPPSRPASSATPGKKVNIDVYYETRCPGCIMFINQTLEPLWRNKGMNDVLNVTLYTYGNAMTIPVAQISEGYKFWHPDTTGAGWDDVHVCQHGGDECLGNMVQLCAKDLGDHDKYMELVFCMSSDTIQGYSVEKSSYECMTKAQLDVEAVKECAQGQKGNQLMTAAGKQTAALKGRLGTPWVMINNQHAADNLLQNATLLMQSVCNEVENVPVSCAQWKAAAAAAHKADAPEHAADPQPGGDGDDFQVFEKNMFKVSPKHV